MSSQQKHVSRIIPVEPGTDLELLKWLTRESFEVTAASDQCRILSYSAGQLDAAQIPVKVADDLPHPVEHYDWWLFTADLERVSDAATGDPVCGYCGHPPHEAHKCDQPGPDWLVPPPTEADPDPQPGPCRCLGDIL